MSLRDRIETYNASSGTVALILGERLAGKTTIAGTLPGKTLLLQAKLRESGTGSAEALATATGNNLEAVLFENYGDLRELITEAVELKYDNIFIDGLSAITEQLEISPEFKRACGSKKNIFDGFRYLGMQVEDLIMSAKTIAIDTGINIFFTMALKRKDVDGAPVILPVCKGNIALEALKKMIGVVVTVTTDPITGSRTLLTRSQGAYFGRIDAILDGSNHGVIEPNLGTLLECIQQRSVNAPAEAVQQEEVSNG